MWILYPISYHPFIGATRSIYSAQEHLLLSQLQSVPALHRVPALYQFAHHWQMSSVSQSWQWCPCSPRLQPLPLHAQKPAQIRGGLSGWLQDCISHAGEGLTLWLVLLCILAQCVLCIDLFCCFFLLSLRRMTYVTLLRMSGTLRAYWVPGMTSMTLYWYAGTSLTSGHHGIVSS